jgi:hypothetical protein
VLFYQRRAPGAPVKTEEEIEAEMKRWDDAQPKTAYGGRYSSTNDLD